MVLRNTVNSHADDGRSIIDIPAQVCITRDNIQVSVDGVLYLVLNPERASYGINDYAFAIISGNSKNDSPKYRKIS
jgi:regulator of protease activity HflC (stomatin/prohibitin superfamily)